MNTVGNIFSGQVVGVLKNCKKVEEDCEIYL